MLFQYKKFNQFTISELMLNRMWFSLPSNFNDPYDSHVHFYYHGNQDDWMKFLNNENDNNEIREKRLLLLNQNIELFEKVFNETNVLINNKMRVACFSESATNFLMWSHYSDYHRGVCIGYETLLTNNKNMVMLEISDNEIDTFNISSKQYLPIQKIEYENKISYEFNQLTQTNEDLSKLMFKKSKIWKYEKEWRLVHSYKSKETIALAENTIDSISIGSKMCTQDERLLNEIVEILNDRRQKKIKLYKIYLNKQTNKLARKKYKLN